MRGFDGKVAIVSGAARGMGLCVAQRLVAEGCRVVMGDILEDVGKQAADELGEDAIFVRLDVTDEASWANIVDQATATFGRLDILVNNAGILAMSLMKDTSLEDYRRMVQVNQEGVFLGMKAVTSAMRDGGSGAIVNVSSIEGMGGGAFLVPYTATKFAVRGMTKAAAWELGRHGIRVNSVHPGAINTDMLHSQTGGTPEADAFMGSKTALGRTGNPEEVAAVMVFLASDDASYMTGAEIAVDGGVSSGSGFSA